MKGWAQRVDPGFLVVAAACLVVAWPFLAHPELPRGTDAELHVFRLAELGRLVRGGELYPRWSPHFYYGYGYPFYNYYAPLTYYLGLVMELLPRLDAVFAVKTLFVGGLLAAGVGMYGFVRDVWGRAAGTVAAAVYVTAPYIFYVDPHARGDLAEAFSFGVFPLALWALQRLGNSGRPGAWLAAVLLTAAVILTHNLMAMVFFGLLLGWVVWQGVLWLREREAAGERVVLPGGALLLGVGLAAFFWLPVALEQEAVNLSSLIGDGSHFDFRNHFVTLRDLLGVPPLLDWGATEQAPVYALGPVQWVLGLVGAVVVLAGRVRERTQALFFVLAAALLMFMMTAASTWLWEALPLLPYMQFPWRLLGATAAMLAVLAGMGTAGLSEWLGTGRERVGRWLAPGLVVVALLAALPLTQVAPWPAEFGPTSREEVVRIELAGRWLGTTSTADFVPATVEVLPQPQDAVLAGFWSGEPLERVNRATVPRHATVTGGEVTPLHFRYEVTAERPFLLRFFIFDFPGWEARIDGEVVEKELGRPEGFIVVPVPAGEHTVELEFMDTPARTVGWVVAGISLLVTVGVAWWLRGREPLAHAKAQRRKQGMALRAAGGALGVWLLLVLLVAPLGWLRYDSEAYTARPAQEETFVNFGDQVALIGFDAPQVVRPGQTVEVTLYWQALRQMEINFQVFVHVLLPDGRTLVAQSDKLNPAGFPTKQWPTDKYVRDAHMLTLPEELPAGEYLLAAGLWVQTEGWRLPVFDDAGEQIGDNYVMRRLMVRE